MKRVFTLVCAGLLALGASAQVTWNVKLGGGLSWAPMSGDKGNHSKSKFVGKIGAGAEIPLSQNFSVMPSLEFAMKGGNYDWSYGENDYGETKINVNYLQIPVMGAYRIALNDRLNMTLKAGPYFAYALSGKSKVEDSDGDKESMNIFNKDDMGGKTAERFDVGVIGGVDFEYHRFVVGAEFEYGFTNMFKQNETEEYNKFSMKNLAAYVTVGYKF